MDEEALKKKAHDYVMNHYDSEGYGTCLGKLEENAYMAGYKVAIADVNTAIDAIFEKLAEREKEASKSEFMALWGGATALSDLRRSIDRICKSYNYLATIETRKEENK